MTKREGVVVPPGGGKHLEEASGQAMSMKLFGRETGDSVTLFEQTVPAARRTAGSICIVTATRSPGCSKENSRSRSARR